MAKHATELLQVVGDGRMLSKWLTRSSQQRAVLVYVTTLAAIHHVQPGKPYLANPDLEIEDQRSTLAVTGQLQKGLLVVAPIAEIIFSRSNRQRDQQDQTHRAKNDELACRRAAAQRTGVVFVVHSASPRCDPGPAWATEKCSHSSQNNQF